MAWFRDDPAIGTIARPDGVGGDRDRLAGFIRRFISRANDVRTILPYSLRILAPGTRDPDSTACGGHLKDGSGWRILRRLAHPAEKPPDRRPPLHTAIPGVRRGIGNGPFSAGGTPSPSCLTRPLATPRSRDGADRIDHLVVTRSLQPLFPASRESLTGTGATFQISWQYSAMARSEENLPIRAVFRMERRAHAARS